MLDAQAARAFSVCWLHPTDCKYNSGGQLTIPFGGLPNPYAGAHSAYARSTHGHWGCGATDGMAKGRSWGYGDRTAASYHALSACSRGGVHRHCHIVSCSASVGTRFDARSTWF